MLQGPAQTGRDLALWPFAAACIGNAIWGFSYLFIDLALLEAPPSILLAARFLIAFALMNLLILTGKVKVSFKGKNIKPLLLLGVVDPIYFYLESYGILYTNVTFAGVLLASTPVFSIALAAILLREYPTRRQVLFSFLPIAGVIMITVAGSSLGIITPLGVFLLLCSCVMAALYKVATRKASQQFSSFERTYVTMMMACIIFTSMAFITSKGTPDALITAVCNPRFILPVLVLSVFCSITAYMLVNYAAEKMTVAQISVFVAIGTLCSTFSGVVFLKEPVTAVTLAGTGLIIVGIWQVSKSGSAS